MRWLTMNVPLDHLQSQFAPPPGRAHRLPEGTPGLGQHGNPVQEALGRERHSASVVQVAACSTVGAPSVSKVRPPRPAAR